MISDCSSRGRLLFRLQNPNWKPLTVFLLVVASSWKDFVSDTDFIDMLRAMQLALVQAQVSPSDIPGFARRVASEFPSADSTINLELARVLGYLKAASLEGRLENIPWR